jgi:large subunit ribosomal protein L22
MAEEKDSKRKSAAAKKPAARTKSAATKTAAGSTAKKAAAKKAAAKKPAEPKTEAKAKPEGKAKPEAKPKTPAKPKAEAKPKPARTKAAATKSAAESKEPQRPVVNARARYVRVAPRKARLVADQVRGLHIDDARTLLRFSARGAARDIAKLIDSAAANAESNHDLVADELRVADIRVDEGPTLRRFRPRALGRATRINKRTSHIHVALTPEE